MVDPDAPSRQKPSHAYWRHWLLVDIKVCRISQKRLWNADAVSS